MTEASHPIARRDFLTRAAAVSLGLTAGPLFAAAKRKVLVTGSSSGLGFLAGEQLLNAGHEVVLHARNETRARQTKAKLPGAGEVVVGDVSTMAGIRSVAEQANALGTFDAVIHNVGVGTRTARKITADGVTSMFAVNVLCPYVLTALMKPSRRLVYLSSRLHARGDASLKDLQWEQRPYDAFQAYSDTKLHDLLLTLYMARRRPTAFVNAVHPGWVPTKMGGPGATDDLQKGAETQVWLAVSEEANAKVSGQYWFHKSPARMHPAAGRRDVQDKLIRYLESVSKVKMPG